MGYAGNYTDKIKLIEMDFHDLFFAFGIVGFLIYLIPLLYFGIKLFIRMITNFKKIMKVKYMLLASTLVLSLGIGFMSGHVLTAPAVSIFFVVILAYIIVDFEIEKRRCYEILVAPSFYLINVLRILSFLLQYTLLLQ